MTSLGATQIKADVGMFYFRTTKNWSYPEKVLKIEEKVKSKIKPLEEKIATEMEKIKQAKTVAEEDGTATCEEKKSLAYKAN